MNDDAKLMRRLLEKCRLSCPVDEITQRHALRTRKSNFNSILKRLGIYTPLYAFITSSFFLFKKLGIGLTVVQSVIALVAITSASTIIIVAGGYALARIMVPDTVKKDRINEESDHSSVSDTQPTGEAPDKIPEGFRHIVYFPELESDGGDKGLASQIRDQIIKELNRLSDRRVMTITPSPAGSDAVLTGSIEKLDDTYLLTVRLTKRQTRKIIFAVSEESNAVERLTEACKKIAGSIAVVLE